VGSVTSQKCSSPYNWKNSESPDLSSRLVRLSEGGTQKEMLRLGANLISQHQQQIPIFPQRERILKKEKPASPTPGRRDLLSGPSYPP